MLYPKGPLAGTVSLNRQIPSHTPYLRRVRLEPISYSKSIQFIRPARMLVCVKEQRRLLQYEEAITRFVPGYNIRSKNRKLYNKERYILKLYSKGKRTIRPLEDGIDNEKTAIVFRFSNVVRRTLPQRLVGPSCILHSSFIFKKTSFS